MDRGKQYKQQNEGWNNNNNNVQNWSDSFGFSPVVRTFPNTQWFKGLLGFFLVIFTATAITGIFQRGS